MPNAGSVVHRERRCPGRHAIVPSSCVDRVIEYVLRASCQSRRHDQEVARASNGYRRQQSNRALTPRCQTNELDDVLRLAPTAATRPTRHAKGVAIASNSSPVRRGLAMFRPLIFRAGALVLSAVSHRYSGRRIDVHTLGACDMARKANERSSDRSSREPQDERRRNPEFASSPP